MRQRAIETCLATVLKGLRIGLCFAVLGCHARSVARPQAQLESGLFAVTAALCDNLKALDQTARAAADGRLTLAQLLVEVEKENASAAPHVSTQQASPWATLMERLYQDYPAFPTRRAFIVDSQSNQFASDAHPRLFLWNGSSTLLAVQDDVVLENGILVPGSIEALDYHCDSAQWQPHLITHDADKGFVHYDAHTPYRKTPAEPSKPLETLCQGCHTQDIRPNWSEYRVWVETRPVFHSPDSHDLIATHEGAPISDQAVMRRQWQAEILAKNQSLLGLFAEDGMRQKPSIYGFLKKPPVDQGALRQRSRHPALANLSNPEFHLIPELMSFDTTLLTEATFSLSAHRMAHRLQALIEREAPDRTTARAWTETIGELLVGTLSWEIATKEIPLLEWVNDTAQRVSFVQEIQEQKATKKRKSHERLSARDFSLERTEYLRLVTAKYANFTDFPPHDSTKLQLVLKSLNASPDEIASIYTGSFVQAQALDYQNYPWVVVQENAGNTKIGELAGSHLQALAAGGCSD